MGLTCNKEQQLDDDDDDFFCYMLLARPAGKLVTHEKSWKILKSKVNPLPGTTSPGGRRVVPGVWSLTDGSADLWASGASCWSLKA